jgi:hypothetical protein
MNIGNADCDSHFLPSVIFDGKGVYRMKRNWIWIAAIVAVFVIAFVFGLGFVMRAGHMPFGMARGVIIERGHQIVRGPWMMGGRGMMGFGGRGIGLLALPFILLLVAIGVILYLRRPASKTTVNTSAAATTPAQTQGNTQNGVGTNPAWTSPGLATNTQNPVAAPPATSVNVCTNCGEPTQEGWVACPHCGEKLTPDEEIKNS